MLRRWIALLAVAAVVGAGESEAKYSLKTRLVLGDRYTCSNTVTYSVTTKVRQAERETSSSEEIQRTERFVDKVVRANEDGELELDRTYLKLYTKVRDSEAARPTVIQSPLRGRRVMVRESSRRRDVQLEGRGAIEPLLRRTIGVELDWRDIFPDDPVGPGDTWDGDANALARRVSGYLSSGHRSKMKVRYEENVVRDGAKQAKLYVDWTLEGMRDRNLFTKVVLAGDVFYDFARHRVVEVDLAGSIAIRGAIVNNGAPQIVKGEGPVTLSMLIKPAPIEAAAGDEAAADSDEDDDAAEPAGK